MSKAARGSGDNSAGTTPVRRHARTVRGVSGVSGVCARAWRCVGLSVRCEWLRGAAVQHGAQRCRRDDDCRLAESEPDREHDEAGNERKFSASYSIFSLARPVE